MQLLRVFALNLFCSEHFRDRLPMRERMREDMLKGAQVGPNPVEIALADGLGSVIDRALSHHPAGEPFVYGIHQAISPAMIELLRGRYIAAGWTRVSLREGETGAYLLVLRP